MLGPVGIEFVGALAAALTTAAFFPQAVRTVRTGDTSGLSPGTFAVFTLGLALWLVYGVLIGSWPLIVANTISLLPQVAIILTLAGGRKRPRE